MNMVLAWRKIRKNIQMKVLICRQWVVLEGEEIRSSPITIHCYVKAYPSISEYQNINLKNPISRWEGCGTSTLTWCRFHCGYTYIAFRRIPGRILQVTFRIPPFNTFQLLIGKYIYNNYSFLSLLGNACYISFRNTFYGYPALESIIRKCCRLIKLWYAYLIYWSQTFAPI